MVKICGLTDERNLQAAIDAGADALGFVFAESLRRISPYDARSLAKIVPPHIQRVAVMMHPSNSDWREVLEIFSPDVLQSDACDFSSLDVPSSVVQWPVYREGDNTASGAGPYVYEGRSSGAGTSVDWQQAATLAQTGQMILAGGLNPKNVATAVRRVRPFGVDVSSGVESKRGVKDARRISEFIKAARAAENDL